MPRARKAVLRAGIDDGIQASSDAGYSPLSSNIISEDFITVNGKNVFFTPSFESREGLRGDAACDRMSVHGYGG